VTVTPLGASSQWSASANEVIAAFLAAYAPKFGIGWLPAIEETISTGDADPRSEIRDAGMFRLGGRILGTLLDAGFGGKRAGAPAIDLPERISELPAADFPRLHRVGERYAAHLSDEAFDHGLGHLLRGLGSDLEVGTLSRPRADRPCPTR
jgi:hypothetical protein